eukprot:CAMPEP_0116846498 /NCGR_PEP_ID=MMETSP0418-20121206/13867_1 /TAXON_ID=1158023 /ORGANISM="Astrosyne radiata, Strain 13vi08-1A" /LENGTH=433 /DNA_ID=CAMNT_0004477749 /DNA_START=334 /DNA_END=1636 /DNA_ORIENTATION=+
MEVNTKARGEEEEKRTNNPETTTHLGNDQSIDVVRRTRELDTQASLSDGEEFGRHKAPPMCDVPMLRKQAMSTDEIRKYAFPSSLTTGSSGSVNNGGLERKSTDTIRQREVNAKVLKRSTSRQGREGQRWLNDPEKDEIIRLVCGCVPILKNGMVLFVSASRKPEWILPKGGWEMDETIEESAIRETYEEAGVIGTLGPSLPEVQYETRKSKKRKLEQNSLSPTRPRQEQEQEPQHMHKPNARIRDGKPPEVPQQYSYVRMTLFPLYISEVRDTWPESGRFRKIMPIDEAIKMLESRPEFRSILMEGKKEISILCRCPKMATLTSREEYHDISTHSCIVEKNSETSPCLEHNPEKALRGQLLVVSNVKTKNRGARKHFEVKASNPLMKPNEVNILTCHVRESMPFFTFGHSCRLCIILVDGGSTGADGESMQK